MVYTSPPIVGAGTLGVISSFDRTGLGQIIGTPASATYPLTNLALYVPFSVSKVVTAYEGWALCGTGTGGNFDVGIYSSAGVRIASSGATARTASSIVNTSGMANTTLVPGVRYYMAFSADDAAETYIAGARVAGIYEAMGILESTSSYVLPTNPTLSRTTRAYLPVFGLNLHTVTV